MTAAPLTKGRRTSLLHWAAVVVLLVSVIATQVALDGAFTTYTPATNVQWVQSTGLMRRLALGFDAFVADVYWIRAVQYYGGTKLSTAERKNYDLLYPMLDMTTTLDPHFTIAYRFAAILLSEGYPNGPGRPEDAIKLLEKGIKVTPDKWQYYHDAGFVEYLWRANPKGGAEWFLKGAKVRDAPNWLEPLAAGVLAEGGERSAARLLWTQMLQTAEHDWLRQTARTRLAQMDAEVQIEQLQPIVNGFYDVAGRFPSGWSDLIRAGRLRGVPVDPANVPYALDPESGAVDVAKASPLYPLKRSGPVSEPSR
jgi:hypothetical protein